MSTAVAEQTTIVIGSQTRPIHPTPGGSEPASSLPDSGNGTGSEPISSVVSDQREIIIQPVIVSRGEDLIKRYQEAQRALARMRTGPYSSLNDSGKRIQEKSTSRDALIAIHNALLPRILEFPQMDQIPPERALEIVRACHALSSVLMEEYGKEAVNGIKKAFDTLQSVTGSSMSLETFLGRYDRVVALRTHPLRRIEGEEAERLGLTSGTFVYDRQPKANPVVAQAA